MKMKRHKIVAQIALLILSVINFALAAPLVRGLREVRVNLGDVAEGVATALRRRRNPSDTWSTNAADGANTPPSLASSNSDSDSDHRLDLELRPPDPGSPIYLSYSSLGSVDWDYSQPLGPPPPELEHDNLDIDINASPHPSLWSTDSDNSHSLPGSPPPAHHNLPLDADINASPQSSPSVNTYPLAVDPLPVAHNNLPLDMDSNASPQPSQEPTGGSDSGSHSTGSSAHSSSNHPMGSASLDAMSPWDWYEIWAISKSPSSSPSHDSNPPPQYDNSRTESSRPLSVQGPTDDQPPPAPPSDPGPSAPHPPSSPGSPQHESEKGFNELFRGRFKRRISGYRSVDAA